MFVQMFLRGDSGGEVNTWEIGVLQVLVIYISQFLV